MSGAIVRALANTMPGNVELVTAHALLHEISKAESYRIVGGRFDYSERGPLLRYLVLGWVMLDRRLWRRAHGWE